MSFSTTAETDSSCELAASNLRFGSGATLEVGQDLKDHLRVQRLVAIFADPYLVRSNHVAVQNTLESLERNGVASVLFDQIRVEPNDVSFRAAADFLTTLEGGYDAVVAVGGGSVLDTAKAANLYARYPPHDFYDYVNPTVGKGLPPPGPVPPLIAIPTTAGTGSETTGVAIFDDTPTQSKTGIAHRHLKPTLGIVDPDNTASLPPHVATYSGLDVLCHAVESYTALPFHRRPKPPSPLLRPAYQGSNPISDVWSLFALETCAGYIHRAVHDGDPEARQQMLLASSAAGLGFGNAGVHLCHGMSYPVSSQNRAFRAPGHYQEQSDHPLVPHGLSVIVNAPAVFRWTGESDPQRHSQCAQILQEARLTMSGGGTRRHKERYQDAGAWLAEEIEWLCDSLNVPLGLQSLGYDEEDIPDLVNGTIGQHRVTKISPRQPVDQKALEHLFSSAM